MPQRVSSSGCSFRCSSALPSCQRHAELIALLDGIIHHSEGHVVLMDVGPAGQAAPRAANLGKTYSTLERAPVIV